MDIEELNKSQIVLLTLLVSFVTSIATGIVTVSLMQQAPPVIAQTVNRVIERTVEKMVPQTQGAAAASVVQEKTIVVTETEIIPQAVAKAGGSIVRVYAHTRDDAAFLGFGVVFSGDGTIVTDAAAIGQEGTVAIALADGTRVTAFVTARVEQPGTAILKAATSTESGPLSWKPIARGSMPVLGSTVIALGGKVKTRVGAGLVTAIEVASFDTDLPNILPGEPLVDTEGSLVGLSTGISRSVSASSFIPTSALIADTAPKTE